MQGWGVAGRDVLEVPVFLPVVSGTSSMGVWLGADRMGGLSADGCGWAMVLREVHSGGIRFLGGFDTAWRSVQEIRAGVDGGSWLTRLWVEELQACRRSRHRLARAFYVAAISSAPGTLMLRLAGPRGEGKGTAVRLCVCG